MRRFSRLDANHRATCDLLRAVGYSVYSTASLGGSFPDFLVGAKGVNLLLEMKAVGPKGGMSAGAKRSLKGEAAWAERWRGAPVIFATYPQDALAAVQRALGVPDGSEAPPG